MATIKYVLLRMALGLSAFFFFALTLHSQQPFTNVTIDCGITQPGDPGIPLFHDGFEVIDVIPIGTGSAFFDYNNDGYLDIYITMRTGRNFMYRNDGPSSDYSFTDVTEILGLEDTDGDGSGVAVADYDNDGFLDIFVGNTNVDKLYRNNNGISFDDVTQSSGIDITDDSRTTSAAWGDYDNDGLLDLYLSRHFTFPGSTNSSTADRMYHNEGNGKFVDVSHLFDISDLLGLGFIGAWSDYDNDGDLDIFVINDCNFGTEMGRTRVFRNDGGTDPVSDWTFTQVAADIGIDFCSNPMGLAVGDIDHNEFQDYAVSDIGPINLWTNEDGYLTDISSEAGVNNQPPGYYSWGINFTDYNLDGWLDLFIAMGSYQFNSNVDPQDNFFYENNGGDGLTFTDKSSLLNMDDEKVARSSVFGDFDNDGDPDFLIINYDEEVLMMKNNNDNGYNWIKLDLEGVVSNRDGIGAKIKITSPSMTQFFETRSGSSLGGGDALEAYFGFGTDNIINEIEITWPSGIVQTLLDIDVNQTLEIQEESNVPVTWLEVNAVKQENVVAINWKTSEEVNNLGFYIEKSLDGKEFTQIGWIESSNRSKEIIDYRFIDKDPHYGINYYRIAQVDINGNIGYSKIVDANFRNTNSYIIYPNPVRNQFIRVYSNSGKMISKIHLLDAKGEVLISKTIGGSESYELAIDGLIDGFYLLRIEGEDEIETKRIVVLK